MVRCGGWHTQSGMLCISLGTLAGGRADDDLFRRVRDVSTYESVSTHARSGDDLMKVIGARKVHM